MLSGGDIVVADYTSDSLFRLDVVTRQQRKLASLKSPNKLTVGPGGKLYVVGIEGDIYVVDADSGKTTMIGRVNGRLRGLTFSPDYKVLYVSDARNNQLLSLQMRPDGTAEQPRVWVRMLGGGPDGMTTDACGNVYVSDHNNSSIRRVTPRGFVEVVANIDRTTSSIGFGSGKQGWDSKTLYTVSVERGGSYEIKVGVPPAPPPP
jgi:gluconolactonase